MKITFGDYSIRSFRKADAQTLAVHGNSYEVSKFLRDSFPYPYTVSDAETWIRFCHGQKIETNFAIAAGEEAIGGIGIRLCADVHRLGGEVGYWIGEAFWGKGITTKAVREFTAYCFERFGLERIWGGVFDGNPASVRVLEKAGYVLEGRLRRGVVKYNVVMDELIYAALNGEWQNP